MIGIELILLSLKVSPRRRKSAFNRWMERVFSVPAIFLDEQIQAIRRIIKDEKKI